MNDSIEEFQRNGELQLMARLSQFKMNTIFDVGANVGDWTEMVLESQPTANVHAFEPMPETFQKYVNLIHPDTRVMPNPFGLSDACEIRDMLFDHNNDKLTTPCLELFRNVPEIRSLIMVDGQSYCASRKIETIDFLKIDTEGHEYKVLKGFGEVLEQKKICTIQFEYGYANVLTKDLLLDFYRLLTPLGYVIGRLSPEGVDFKTYGLFDEDFQGPNHIAVHESSPDIIEVIQKK